MAGKIACIECGLSLLGEGAPNAAILTRFPQDLGACFAHFALGPSVLLCPACQTPNDVPIPTIMVEPGSAAVVYVPENFPAADLAALEAGLDEAKVSINEDRRKFRTDAIRAFLAPRLALLNDYLLAEKPYAWIADNEDSIDPAFSAALWLALTAKVQMFQSAPLRDGEAFRRHEEVDPALLRLEEQEKARVSVVENVAGLLGRLLHWWAAQSMERRSFADYIAATPRLACRPALDGSIGEALADKIAEISSTMQPGEPGAILYRHVVETMLALLFDAHGLRNPRARPWTIAALLYEYGRRIDGNEGYFSLDGETCGRLLDPEAFAEVLMGLAQGIGPLDADTKERHFMLIEAAGQLSPEQTSASLKPSVVPAAAAGQDEARQLDELLDLALGLEDDQLYYGLEPILRGIRPEGLAELPAFLERIAARAADRLGARDLTRLARLAVELLNAAARYDEAWTIARAGVERLPALAPDDEVRGFFLNEVGNCHRYAGRFAEALAVYEQALDVVGRDLDNPNGRVALRNIAIVLRDSNRYAAALERLAQLRPHMQGAELVGNVTSEALCLYRLGEPEKGLALLDRYRGLAENLAGGSVHARAFLGLRSQLLSVAGSGEEAAALARSLRDQARAAGDLLVLASANLTLLKVEPDEALQAETVELLRALVRRLTKQAGLGHTVAGMVEQLHGLLIDGQEWEAAAALLDEAIPALWPTGEPSLWSLLTLRLADALGAGDSEKASEALVMAVLSFQQALSEIADVGDPAKVLGPFASRLEYLVSTLVEPAAAGSISPDSFLSLLADLPAAPVLTAHLRRSAGLAMPMSDKDAHAGRVADLLAATPATLVQIVSLQSGIGLVVTRAGEGSGLLDYEARALPILAADAERLSSRLAFHLSRIPPAGDLALHEVKGWEDFASALRACLPQSGPDEPLVVAPGPLSPIAVSLAAGPEATLSFTPALEALIALRGRREALPGGLSWRPESLFDFAVWRRGEKPRVAEGLAASVETGAALAAELGLRHSSAVAEQADREALLSGLRESDIVRLTCHGRLLRREETIDLIVAEGDQLPPSSALALLNPASAGHILGWRELSADRAAPLVISSACHSGDAVRHRGGERLGLERPLFAAGTFCYVAPMWPVPSLAAQDFSSELLRRRLVDGKRPLAVSLAQQRRDWLGQGRSPLAAAAFAAFGDAL